MKQGAEQGAAQSRQEMKPRRKPYVAPQMIEYGQVAKLTRGASGTVGDGVGAMQMLACL